MTLLKECHILKSSSIYSNPCKAAANTNSEKLIIPYCRTSIGKKSLLYQQYKIWNLEIPANIKNKESYNNFAKNYHKYLLDKIETT